MTVFLIFLLHSMHCLFSAPVPFDGTDGDLKKGIIFHEDKKILLAEKFINIQFLLPFPQFDIFIKDELRNITNTLHSMWKMPTFFCNLQFTNVSMEDFQVHWLVNEVQKEVSLAETAIINLRKEVASLLSPPIQSPSSNRSKRALPLAPIALGAIGLFGSGVAMGAGDCGLMGILGNCQARENKEAINRMFTAQSQLFENFEHLRTVTNDKFYIVSRELQSIYDVQNQMAEIQNANWHLISEQLETFRQDIHEMRNCDQLLFTRQQINFNFDTVASLLALFYSNIKAYSAALFAYRLNLLNSVPTLLNKYVPMSLLTRDSLERVLLKVGDIQFNSDDRLTLAIPFNDLMSYYDAQLLQDVVTLEKGLFLTMSIPLASKQTVMTIYQAIPIPMPQPDEDIALLWDIESEYLAVSADARETALLSHRDIGHCIGSARYSICRQGIATEGLYSSCLSLFSLEILYKRCKYATWNHTNCPLPNELSIFAMGSGSLCLPLPTFNYVAARWPLCNPLTLPQWMDAKFVLSLWVVVNNSLAPIYTCDQIWTVVLCFQLSQRMSFFRTLLLQYWVHCHL